MDILFVEKQSFAVIGQNGRFRPINMLLLNARKIHMVKFSDTNGELYLYFPIQKL